MINYAIKHRYTYVRWRKIVTQVIYKILGNKKIHKLRINHLYEADLNFLLGYKWRAAIRFAQDNEWINTSQYGGVPGREATGVSLHEEFRYDHSRMAR